MSTVEQFEKDMQAIQSDPSKLEEMIKNMPPMSSEITLTMNRAEFLAIVASLNQLISTHKEKAYYGMALTVMMRHVTPADMIIALALAE